MEAADFVKVETLRPDLHSLDLKVKVVDANLVVNRPAGKAGGAVASRVAECTVGDETGVIVLIAKNEQVDAAQPGKSLVLKNARVDMFKASMRLVVGQSGSIAEAEEAFSFKPKADHNLSLIEFELVPLPTQNGVVHSS